MIIWEEGNFSTSPINLLNVIWTITVNEILQTKEQKSFTNATKISLSIKGEPIASTKAYPQKNFKGNR